MTYWFCQEHDHISHHYLMKILSPKKIYLILSMFYIIKKKKELIFASTLSVRF